jgi:hypothetical protein
MFCAPAFVFGSTEGAGTVFMFCAPGLIFDDTKGVWSRFHVFALRLIYGGNDGVGSRFHVLRSRARFRLYQGRRVQFSWLASGPVSTVPRASGPVFMLHAPGLVFGVTNDVCPIFMFCSHGLIFGGSESIGSRLHVFLSRTRFRWYRGRRLPFSFFRARTRFRRHWGVRSRFHFLHSRSHFRRYLGSRFPSSSFAPPHSLSAERRASAPVLMFCAPQLDFDDTGGVSSRFYVLRARTHFRRYRGRRVPFSYFALPDLFLAVPRATGTVFIFCDPGIIFDGTKGVGSRFNVLRSRTRFRWYRGRRVPFSCFAPGIIFDFTEGVGSRFHVLRSRTRFRRCRRPQVMFSCFVLSGTFPEVQRSSGPVFMFCAPESVSDVTKGVGSRFHVLRSRTRF